MNQSNPAMRMVHRLMRTLMLLALAMAGAAWADPPGRVGRVADVNGAVWLYSADQGDWVQAELNRPLTSGDRLSTERGARAELRIGSTTLRVDGGTELEMLQLDDSRMAFELHAGTVAATLRNAEAAAQFEIRTDQGSFLTQAPGRYRFDRFGDASHATVQAGQALYEGPGSALPISPGQRAEFWLASPTAAEYTLAQPLNDAFAQWDADRERAESRMPVARYVSPEMTGVEDLAAYGEWVTTPDDGPLWLPSSVPTGWVPYGAGHWTWMAPWGWTWVDDMRWGFAPFHYGRWVMHGRRWGWAPGSYVARPVYAPALVGWVGEPRSAPGGRGGPPVGWFPLAPREVYVPPYRVSPGYVRNVNITHVSNIANLNLIVSQPQRVWEHADFRNRRLPQAITTVPGSVFAGREAVAPAAARWREGPQAREHAAPGRGLVAQADVTLVAPPVAAPPSRGPAPDGRHAGVPPAPGRVEQPLRPGERGGIAGRPAPFGNAAPPPAVQPIAGQERRGFQPGFAAQLVEPPPRSFEMERQRQQQEMQQRQASQEAQQQVVRQQQLQQQQQSQLQRQQAESQWQQRREQQAHEQQARQQQMQQQPMQQQVQQQQMQQQQQAQQQMLQQQQMQQQREQQQRMQQERQQQQQQMQQQQMQQQQLQMQRQQAEQQQRMMQERQQQQQMQARPQPAPPQSQPLRPDERMRIQPERERERSR